jgi:glycosyltransferase involved in cell wall biosynthesis
VARILFLTQVLSYPLDSGAKIRAYYVLRHLAHQHRITLVSFVRDDNRPEDTAHLAQFCETVHTVPMQRSRWRDLRAVSLAWLTGQSTIIVRDEIPAMHALLKQLMTEQSFDVIHADQASMAQYALYAAQLQIRNYKLEVRDSPSTILDAHNALFHIPERLAQHERNPLKRWVLQREARALARYEAQTYPKFARVVFVSAEDRTAIQEQIENCKLEIRDGRSKIENRKSSFPIPGSQFPISNSPFPISDSPIIPICVDPDDRPLVQRVPHPRTILSLGTMFWPPNVEGVLWFAREVFPRVLERAPDARFVVVGKNPPASVQTLATTLPNVEVTGYMPDPAPYLAETAAFIVPLNAGGGMRVKIVDAWGWGLPIVSTTIGAEGIDVRDGENILLGNTPEAFAEAVLRLLENPALGESLRANGRQWVETRYNWRTVYAQWDEVYQGVNAGDI